MYKAYAMYLTDLNTTPEAMKGVNISIKNLHFNLKQLDSRWASIPTEHIITSNERKLIQGLNTDLARWKKKVEEV